MLLVQNTVISDEIAEKEFVCNISKCKGACCIEGDLGAPLEVDELLILEKEYDKISSYLTEEGKKVIADQGKYIKDEENDFSTPLMKDGMCAYGIREANGSISCGIEKAHKDGLIDYKKPISCHLYPVRINTYESYDAINYDRWDICSDACILGKELKIELYKFLKEPLIRKYGEEWYEELEEEISTYNRKHSI